MRSGAAEGLLGGKRGEERGEERGEGKGGDAEKGEGVPNGKNDVIIIWGLPEVSPSFLYNIKGCVCFPVVGVHVTEI